MRKAFRLDRLKTFGGKKRESAGKTRIDYIKFPFNFDIIFFVENAGNFPSKENATAGNMLPTEKHILRRSRFCLYRPAGF